MNAINNAINNANLGAAWSIDFYRSLFRKFWIFQIIWASCGFESFEEFNSVNSFEAFMLVISQPEFTCCEPYVT